MNFISMTLANTFNFISERVSALGVTTKFICLAAIVLVLLDLASARCFNDFYTNGQPVIMNRKRDIKLITVHILANLAALAIVTFILCRIAFALFCGAAAIIPIAITVVIIAEPAVLIGQDMSRFVYTFKTRYILPIF